MMIVDGNEDRDGNDGVPLCLTGHTLPRCCLTLMLTEPVIQCSRCKVYAHADAKGEAANLCLHDVVKTVHFHEPLVCFLHLMLGLHI